VEDEQGYKNIGGSKKKSIDLRGMREFKEREGYISLLGLPKRGRRGVGGARRPARSSKRIAQPSAKRRSISSLKRENENDKRNQVMCPSSTGTGLDGVLKNRMGPALGKEADIKPNLWMLNTGIHVPQEERSNNTKVQGA